MLAPNNRALLLDALRPAQGQTLDRAVATTFTLDLTTALTVPLAFAGFRLDEQPDPIEVMEALRGVGERLDIFCQAGAINVSERTSDLFALLENVIYEVRRPRPHHVFHPKVWVLRYLDQLQEPFFRLLVLSRNLTADRSWDTMLRLEGRLGGRRIASNAPLARFVGALPGLTVTQFPPSRGAEFAGLAEELRRVQWDLPEGAWEIRFHPMGLPRSRRFPVEEHFRGYRKLAISPFVRDEAIRRLLSTAGNQKAVLVSRGEELATLRPSSLDNLDVYELDPTASISFDEVQEDERQTFLTHLHAKIFAVERARRAHLFVGSANATDAGLGSGNIEFLCQLTGSVAKLGVDALVGEGAPFREMLTPYVGSESPETDESSMTARKLQDLLIDTAAGARFRTTITERAHGWVPRVKSDAELPRFPKGTLVTIAAYNRPAETCPLMSHEPADIELPPRELADVTPFLQLTASRTVEGQEVARSAVVCSRLEGAPDARFQEIMARQIDTTEKFFQLIALLIGFVSRGSGDTTAEGNGSASWSAGAGQGFLELLARALSERPEAIAHLASIIEYLRRPANGEAILPSGWDDVWQPALEARRAMLREES